MRRNYRTQKVFAEINITPFTDVILVLLIIFMVTTPLIYQAGLKVKLPQASAAQPLNPPTRVSIDVTIEGQTYLDKELVTENELTQKMSAIHHSDPAVAVILNIDKATVFNNVVKVLDILSELGIENLYVSAAAKRQEESQGSPLPSGGDAKLH
jgi:biopolymer transport protein ExbD